MPSLQCNVTNCANNCEQHCCRPIIKVEGQEASKACDTSCRNFVQQGHQPTSGAVPGAYSQANLNIDIKCAATGCAYNRNHMCSAPSVDITGMGASQSGQTECHTFRAK
ncbi:MAG: DUF1540 domain-containing protein [Eubacteriales bacterium]|jgi:hypothetical protein